MTVTPEQLTAFVLVCRVVADAIKELGSVPSGVLYANLCGYLDITTYTQVIESLKRTGLVQESNHLLTWVEQGHHPKQN